MRHATQTAAISSPAAVIRDTLLAATRLPEWNPAFVNVAGPAVATVAAEYELETIRGLRGSLAYTRIDAEQITMTWRVPLLSETGTWLIEEHGPARTQVTHTVERHGPLAAAISHTLATLPRLRLDRLAVRTEDRSAE